MSDFDAFWRRLQQRCDRLDDRLDTLADKCHEDEAPAPEARACFGMIFGPCLLGVPLGNTVSFEGEI